MEAAISLGRQLQSQELYSFSPVLLPALGQSAMWSEEAPSGSPQDPAPPSS
jgi:hypothetical protein